MFRRARFFAPDAGTGGGVTVTRSSFEEAMADDDDEGGQELRADPGIDYVVEGDPSSVQEEGELTRGKSREELAEVLRKNQEELERERAARTSGSDAVVAALSRIMPQQPAAAPVEGFRIPIPQQQQPSGKTAEELKMELETRFLANPTQVVQELVNQQLGIVTATFGENQGLLGRELALTNAENAKVYERYANEVETFVAKTPVAERLKDPKIYQKAIASVRAAHYTEFMDDEVNKRVEEALNKKLAELGLQGGQTPAGRVPVTTARLNPQAAPGASRPRVVIPRWVAQKADREGKDPGALYELLKETGQIR